MSPVEVDLTARSMLLRVSVDSSDPTSVYATINLLLPDGRCIPCRDRRLKVGPMEIFDDDFRL